MYIISADISLRRPAFVFLELKDKKIAIHNELLVDNKNKKKTHGEILSDIYLNFLKFCSSCKKPDVFIREMALGTRCFSTTMTLNKAVGVTDLALWNMYGMSWDESLRPVTIKHTVAGKGNATKDE
jgi:Holliday junction resolvasome RuvABC endonuclease subunit